MGLQTADHAITTEQLLPPTQVRGIGPQVRGSDLEQRCPVRVAQHLNHRGVGVEDFPGGRGLAQADGKVVEQPEVSVFRLFQRLQLRFSFEGASDHPRQASVLAGRFEHIVVQPGFHCFDGHLFAAGAGEHDDRTLGPAGLDRPEHGQPVRPPQSIIGDDQIALARLERTGKVLRVGHLIDLEVGKIAAQLADDQNAVFRIVVHQQDADLVIHATSPDRQGGIA